MIYMDIVIREIESKDYMSVAAIWHDVLGVSSVTDETVAKNYRFGFARGYKGRLK